jgi:hypothetical protein
MTNTATAMSPRHLTVGAAVTVATPAGVRHAGTVTAVGVTALTVAFAGTTAQFSRKTGGQFATHANQLGAAVNRLV